MRDIDNTVLSSRVRLARNVAGLPFPHKLESEAAFGFMKKVSDLLKNTDRFSLYLMSRLDDLRKKALVERHLISPDLTKNSRCGAVMINADESVAVMLNEEDHIREQSIVKGFDISGAYERVRRVDDRIISGVSLAYDDALGFLTSCPTNVGTGMRASVMMFLPALTRSGKMPSLVKALTAKKMTVRGIYGEGSENSGYLYQISNKISLGYGEEEILRSVNAAAVRLCEFEAEERQALYQGNHISNMISCAAYDIRALDIQGFLIAEERFHIEFSDIPNRLPCLPGALLHLVLTVITITCEMSDIRDIHHMPDFIA